MKKASFSIAMAMMLTIGCTENDVTDTNAGLATKLSDQIDSLYTIDQSVQRKLSKAIQNGEKVNIDQLLREEDAIFKRHIPLLKGIYRQIGYPTIQLVGEESSKHFFTMVQHSDADVPFQEEMLHLIEAEVKKGNVNGRDFAFLTDRVLIAKKKPQLYGTQLDYNTEIAQAYPKELLNAEDVNDRRMILGLEPIEEYLNKASTMHFKNSKNHYDKLGVDGPTLYSLSTTH